MECYVIMYCNKLDFIVSIVNSKLSLGRFCSIAENQTILTKIHILIEDSKIILQSSIF